MDVGRHWWFYPTLQKLEANLFFSSETIHKTAALNCGILTFKVMLKMLLEEKCKKFLSCSVAPDSS